MKSGEKSTKVENLEFHWDKSEQLYSERQDYIRTDKSTKRNVEEYFKFLSDIEPACVLPVKDRIADKQFTLY